MVKIRQSIFSHQTNQPCDSHFNLENPSDIDRLAWESGYYRQEAKKITGSSLVWGFFNMMSLGLNTLSAWCVEIGLMGKCAMYKSSLHERLDARTLSFVQAILQQTMELRMKQAYAKQGALKPGTNSLLRHFGNVLLCDSTCAKLPSNLAEYFPSSYSHGEPTATLRVQTIYNYRQEQFERFKTGSFRDNDQSESNLILEVAQPGDLVLRDLGYFVLENLRKMTNMGIFFISKFRLDTTIYAALSGEKIDLLAQLKKKKRLDIPVLIGSKEKLPLRLVAEKLPEQVARKKRQKARQDRNRKTNHSEEYYELLGWVVFVTNIEDETLGAQQIAEVYRVRWFIEVIFKAWKSHFNFTKVFEQQKMNYWRAHITILLVLIRIAYWSLEVYRYIKNGVDKLTDRPLSILKYFSVLNLLSCQISTIRNLMELDTLIPQFAIHATYERRKNRQNFKEQHIC